MCAFQNDEENLNETLEVQTVAETDDLFVEHSEDEIQLGTPRFTQQDAWDRERFFLGRGPGTDHPLGHERDACFVCVAWLPNENAREGFDYWRNPWYLQYHPPSWRGW